MSSGLEFIEVEFEPGKWYWIRQSGSCPVECWDWREYDPDVVGPFDSQEALEESYRQHECNTGGASIDPYDPTHPPSDTIKKLVATAQSPDKRYGRSISFGYRGGYR